MAFLNGKFEMTPEQAKFFRNRFDEHNRSGVNQTPLRDAFTDTFRYPGSTGQGSGTFENGAHIQRQRNVVLGHLGLRRGRRADATRANVHPSTRSLKICSIDQLPAAGCRRRIHDRLQRRTAVRVDGNYQKIFL